MYALSPDSLWNARPHYHKSDGWCFYFYASNEGGASGWSLHSESVPLGASDWCDGGWIGPFTYSHPPLGGAVGFNGEGRCAVKAEPGAPDASAQVHSLLQQHRQNLVQAFAPQMQMSVTTTTFVPIAQPVMPTTVPVVQAVAGWPPMVPVAQPVVVEVSPVVDAQLA